MFGGYLGFPAGCLICCVVACMADLMGFGLWLDFLLVR